MGTQSISRGCKAISPFICNEIFRRFGNIKDYAVIKIDPVCEIEDMIALQEMEPTSRLVYMYTCTWTKQTPAVVVLVNLNGDLILNEFSELAKICREHSLATDK